MVFDLLTLEDKQRILSYRDEYAYSSHGRACNIETLLAPWNNAKSGYLHQLFGDNLIVKRPVEFKEDLQQIADRMDEMVYQENRTYKFIKDIQNIYYERCKGKNWDSPEYDHKSFVCALFNTWDLAKNKVSDDYFSDKSVFELPIGDTIYKVQKGMKPIRVITKIANAYGIGITTDEDGISDLEYFRRRHSLGLNQKTLKGELCLSIHPLDYMTMSDNEEGWESCMNWRDDGEYKQGTVEMMNSPCVVVGYLASERNKLCWADEEWNSKKWRSLFIVDPRFIINVRSYPYDNNNLVKAAIAELADMAGWGKIEAIKYEYLEKWEEYRKNKIPVVINDRKIAIDFRTQAMYNDFGWGHYIALNPNSTEDVIEHEYYYSGLSECVWCGTTDDSIVGKANDPSALHCTTCGCRIRCQWCGETTNETYTTADGIKLCEYCWDEHTVEDKITNEIYCEDNDELVRIYLSTKKDRFETGPYYTRKITINSNNFGTNQWYKYFNIAEPVHTIVTDKYGYIRDYDYVFIDDCKEAGLELFDIYDEDDIKEYLGEDSSN